MGRPKKCDYSPNPFLRYSETTTTPSTTTTIAPLDLSSYIDIPISGESCPTTTTTTTTSTTTTLPPFDPQHPCASYSYLPDDQNGAVLKFAPCDNDNSVNQIIIGTIQRLDFCAERSAPVSILSGNGRLVYNGGCDRFVNIVQTTTTTTTTTTTPPILPQLEPPILTGFINTNQLATSNCFYRYTDYTYSPPRNISSYAPRLDIYISSPWFDLLYDVGKTIGVYWNKYRIDYYYYDAFNYSQSEPINDDAGYILFDKFNTDEKLVRSYCMYYYGASNDCQIAVGVSQQGGFFTRRLSEHYFTAQAFVIDNSYAPSELVNAGSWCFSTNSIL